MNNKQKLFIIIIATAIVSCLVIGATFAYWTWSTNSAQVTSVTFTVASGFTCSADGGGSITSNDIQLVPGECTNATSAIKRTITINTTQDSDKVIYLDMKLKVDSISANLSASQNFKYALTTSSDSCESGTMAEGTFNGASANDELPLLTKEQYLSSTTDDTFYLWIWLDKKETNSNTMNQTFKLSITGSCTDQEPAKTYAPWGAEVDMYKRIDFSKPSSYNSESNGQGLYVFKTTLNDATPIYYYRGAVADNNVLFGGFCWKIVRSTETGGTKLIYNGIPTSGECTATTGTDTQIGTSVFNTSKNSPAYVGYMYGTVYTDSNKQPSELATSYKYGNRFTYDGTNYTLVDTKDSTGTWNTDYLTLNNYHYTCFNTSGTCSSLYYIYYMSLTPGARYITLTNGKSVEQALDEMLTSSSNTINSDIKIVVDNWYNANLTSYTSNLEDAIWCNDRSIFDLSGWNPNGGTGKYLWFGPRRLSSYRMPSLHCTINDSFTVSSSNGNGDLTYPVGLITGDELIMAGSHVQGYNNNTFYLYTNSGYWSSSPQSYWATNDFFPQLLIMHITGGMQPYVDNGTSGVRPMISLKSGGTWSGSGTSTDPYTVSYS